MAYAQKMLVVGSKAQTSPVASKPSTVNSSPKVANNGMYLVQQSSSTKNLVGLKVSPKN